VDPYLRRLQNERKRSIVLSGRLILGGFFLFREVSMPQTIRDVRLGHGVSQMRLALVLGISQRHLSRFELGQAAIDEQRTREVLRAIEVAATIPRVPRRVHKRI
jgi:DNA-binding XRE family transcriptional regulator